MFSKRPRRDKILVALTAFTVSAGIAVPLGLIFGGRQTTAITLVPVTKQPDDASFENQIEYSDPYKGDPPTPATPSSEFVFLTKEQVIVAAPDPAQVGKPFDLKDFSPYVPAGVQWEVRYVFTPASGYVGKNYVYTVKNTIIPKPVVPNPKTLSFLATNPIVYGTSVLPEPSWPEYQAVQLENQPADTKGFLEQTGYLNPVFVKAQKRAAGSSQTLDITAAEYPTVSAGSALIAHYEMRTDANHTGDPVQITIEYQVSRAKVANPPAEQNYPPNLDVPDVTKRQQFVYGKAPNYDGAPDYIDPNDDPALAAALRAAKYKPYTRRKPVLKSVPAGTVLPTGVAIDQPLPSDNALAALPAGSTVQVRWVADHDDDNDLNYEGDPASVYYIYTVIKADFVRDGALTQPHPSDKKMSIDISENELPTEAQIFAPGTFQSLPKPYLTSKSPRVLAFYILDSNNQRVSINSISDLRNYFNNGLVPDSYLYVTLTVPFDWDNYTFETKTKEQKAADNEQTDFVLTSRLPITNAQAGSTTNP